MSQTGRATSGIKAGSKDRASDVITLAQRGVVRNGTAAWATSTHGDNERRRALNNQTIFTVKAVAKRIKWTVTWGAQREKCGELA